MATKALKATTATNDDLIDKHLKKCYPDADSLNNAAACDLLVSSNSRPRSTLRFLLGANKAMCKDADTLRKELDENLAEVCFQSIGILPSQREYREMESELVGNLLLADVRSMRCMQGIRDPQADIQAWLLQVLEAGEPTQEQTATLHLQVSLYRAGINADGDMAISSECEHLRFALRDGQLRCRQPGVGVQKMLCEMHDQCPTLRIALVARRRGLRAIKYPEPRVSTQHLIAAAVWTACEGVYKLSPEEILDSSAPNEPVLVRTASIFHSNRLHSNSLLSLILDDLMDCVAKMQWSDGVEQVDLVIVLSDDVCLQRQYYWKRVDLSNMDESIDSVVNYFGKAAFGAIACAYCMDGTDILMVSWACSIKDQKLSLQRLEEEGGEQQQQ